MNYYNIWHKKAGYKYEINYNINGSTNNKHIKDYPEMNNVDNIIVNHNKRITQSLHKSH